MGALNCANDSEIARYDLANGTWYCDSESVDSASVISVVEAEPNLALQSGASVAGQTIVTTPPNCVTGQILSYDSPTNTWSCIDFSTIVDQDSDGVLSWNDCDDTDPLAGSSVNDADCDGVSTTDDCDDTDPQNTNTNIQDADCDGVPTTDDCDDADPTLLYLDGSHRIVQPTPAWKILQNGYSTGDGTYWIQPGSTAIEAECDMTTDGGGYTYYGVTGAITTSKYTDNNTCKTLGMDIVYPRRQTHWASMFARYNSSYFATVPGVYKTSSGGNYTGCAMNSSGCGDWRVGDGGDWWIHRTKFWRAEWRLHCLLLAWYNRGWLQCRKCIERWVQRWILLLLDQSIHLFNQ